MARKKKDVSQDTLDTRKKYVLIAIRILEEEGIDALSVRRVADEVGCTCAVLYRHFENKRDLLMVAAVKFLQPYIKRNMIDWNRDDLNFIQKNLKDWKTFIDDAFWNKPYYELFFSDPREDNLYEYMLEYYRLFPSEMVRFDGFTGTVILNTNVQDRELICLRRAANKGFITMENADLLSRLDSAVFDGIFSRCPSDKNEGQAIQTLADECFKLVAELYSKYVNPDVDLSAAFEED